MKKITVQNTLVTLTSINDMAYISLTDIARVRNPDEPKDVVKNWLRNRSTIEYLGLWEKIKDPEFKGVEFDAFKVQAGSKKLAVLNAVAITQLTSLTHNRSVNSLK